MSPRRRGRRSPLVQGAIARALVRRVSVARNRPRVEEAAAPTRLGAPAAHRPADTRDYGT